MNYDKLLAARTSNMKASAIRELLKVAANPGMISLGGGLPSPDSFPLDLVMELTEKVIKKYGSVALQYDMTEGFTPLRKALIAYLKEKGIAAGLENIYITSGSQGFLDAIGKLLISPGDYVAVEGPTYLAALQAFNAYEAAYVQIETDDEGLIPESLEEIITSYTVKFVYTVPTFQNPSGKTIGTRRREAIAEIIRKYDVLLVEDDPYSALRYKGEALPTIKSMAPDNVIYASTFSKIFAPGMRVGYFVAPESIGRWMVIVKQGVDLNTCTFTQALATEYLLGGYVPQQVRKITDLYRPKLDTMLNALEKYFPDDYKWSKPEGGMFLWVAGPKGLDMEDVSKRSIGKGVGFVPGRYFFPNPKDGIETMRLNFTNVSEEQIQHAIKTLSEILKEEREQGVYNMDFINSWGNQVRAESYAKLEFPNTYYLAYRDIPEIISKHVQGNKAVDFGCGAGRSTRFLKKLGFDVVGIDIARDMLERAKKLDNEVDYQLVSNGNYSHIGVGAFDLVQSIFTFDNIPGWENRTNILASLRDLLKPTGRMILLDSTPELYTNEWASFTVKDFPDNWHAKTGDIVRDIMLDVEDQRPVEDVFWTEQDYCTLFDRAGLECEAVYKPLGREDEPFDWVTETKIAPWMIFILKKRISKDVKSRIGG